MPALTKEKLVRRVVQTPTRIHPRSLTNNDVKRLGPSRRISSKRTQTQATQTALASFVLTDIYKQTDEGTQTNNDINSHGRSSVDGFASRLVKIFGGTLVTLMKLFNPMK